MRVGSKEPSGKSRAALRPLLLAIFFTGLLGDPTFAATDIVPNAEIQADPETVKSILATFDQAEKALRSRNLPDIMAVYSDDYQNLGLRKKETERIWQGLFSRYRIILSKHLFSKIVVDRNLKKADVTCTGELHFRNKNFKPEGGAEPLRVQYWFEAVHHLVWEGGMWKIYGHDPGQTESNPSGSPVHLLF